ncbi:hypothetical protein ABW21_db0209868 [Orbilia brochopaga]|nr:hypothetical protein ABW21_db0209868 [Drechslerella brochopaga]
MDGHRVQKRKKKNRRQRENGRKLRQKIEEAASAATSASVNPEPVEDPNEAATVDAVAPTGAAEEIDIDTGERVEVGVIEGVVEIPGAQSGSTEDRPQDEMWIWKQRSKTSTRGSEETTHDLAREQARRIDELEACMRAEIGAEPNISAPDEETSLLVEDNNDLGRRETAEAELAALTTENGEKKQKGKRFFKW